MLSHTSLILVFNVTVSLLTSLLTDKRGSDYVLSPTHTYTHAVERIVIKKADWSIGSWLSAV